MPVCSYDSEDAKTLTASQMMRDKIERLEREKAQMFRKGQEAMRERAGKLMDKYDGYAGDGIRALPLQEPSE